MKNQYDMLNDINNNFDDIEEVTLTQSEKEAITKRVKKKIPCKKKTLNKGAIAAAALALTITGSLFFTNENVLAAMTSLGQKLEAFLGKEFDEYAPYKNEILLEIEDKGIKLQLHEAMIDNDELFISTSVDYSNCDVSLLPEEALEGYSIIPATEENPYRIFVNGENFPSNGNSLGYHYNEDAKTVDIFTILNMNGADLKEIYDVRLEINAMEIQLKSMNNPTIEGDWTLDFQITNSQIADTTRTIVLNQETSIIHDDIEIPITLEEVKTSPLSTLFTYNIPFESLPDYVDVEFNFFDEHGNKLNFDLISSSHMDGKFTYKSMDAVNIESLTVQPVIISYDNAWNSLFNTKGEKIELNLE